MFKIEVVEDERLEQEAICQMIENSEENWKIVATASSGPQALDMFEEADPDIILLDIHIPEIDGLEVLRQIKKKDPFKRVIIITAFDEFDFAHQAIKAKVDDFLLKPIRPQQLYEAVRSVSQTIKSSEEEELDEKRKLVLYEVVHKNYSKTRKALQNYIDTLYQRAGTDLIRVQSETQRFLSELNEATKDICKIPVPDARKLLRVGPETYKDRYQLYIELKRIVDRIFDIIIDQDRDSRNTMEGILNYIDRNCHKDISLNQVGNYANMSSYYLSKIFKKETGVNFVTYLTDRKIELAKDMLVYTDIPIINIALELSYHEPNYFSKVFKKSTGVTPTEYRKQKKKLDQ